MNLSDQQKSLHVFQVRLREFLVSEIEENEKKLNKWAQDEMSPESLREYILTHSISYIIDSNWGDIIRQYPEVEQFVEENKILDGYDWVMTISKERLEECIVLENNAAGFSYLKINPGYEIYPGDESGLPSFHSIKFTKFPLYEKMKTFYEAVSKLQKEDESLVMSKFLSIDSVDELMNYLFEELKLDDNKIDIYENTFRFLYTPSTTPIILDLVRFKQIIKDYQTSTPFQNRIKPLKQNDLTITKEIRSIKNETLYGIADKLLRVGI